MELTAKSQEPENIEMARSMARSFAIEILDRFNPEEVNQALSVIKDMVVYRREDEIESAKIHLEMLTKSLAYVK